MQQVSQAKRLSDGWPRCVLDAALQHLQALYHSHSQPTRLFWMVGREGATDAQIPMRYGKASLILLILPSSKTDALAKSLSADEEDAHHESSSEDAVSVAAVPVNVKKQTTRLLFTSLSFGTRFPRQRLTIHQLLLSRSG